jgi:predicted nucleic acid-binding protein
MEKSDVVTDAGPLIHLDELDCLHLLSDFRSVLLPPAVRAEVEIHRPSALDALPFQLAEPPASPQTSFLSMAKAFSLGPGEREALLVMHRHPLAILLTDDAAARLSATLLGFRVHGTIGILIRAIRSLQLSSQQAISLIEQIPSRSSLFIRQDLLHEILSRLRTEFPEK